MFNFRLKEIDVQDLDSEALNQIEATVTKQELQQIKDAKQFKSYIHEKQMRPQSIMKIFKYSTAYREQSCILKVEASKIQFWESDINKSILGLLTSTEELLILKEN